MKNTATAAARLEALTLATWQYLQAVKAHRESAQRVSYSVNAACVPYGAISPEAVADFERTRLALIEAETQVERLTRGY